MNELKIFNFESNEVRTQIVNGEPWFVAKDVCDILGIVNVSDAVGRLNPSFKTTIGLNESGSNYKTNALIINEAGLYKLIFKSRKEEADLFSDWVALEVLPSIRNTGSYQVAMSQEDIMIATLENQKEIKQRLNTVSEDVEDLKNEIDLSRLQKATLSKLVKTNVMTAVGGKKSNAYSKLYRVAISEHWRDIKNYFEVASYEEIPKVRFKEAMELASMWRPSMQLAFDIKCLNTQLELEVI